MYNVKCHFHQDFCDKNNKVAVQIRYIHYITCYIIYGTTTKVYERNCVAKILEDFNRYSSSNWNVSKMYIESKNFCLAITERARVIHNYHIRWLLKSYLLFYCQMSGKQKCRLMFYSLSCNHDYTHTIHKGSMNTFSSYLH